MWTLTVVVVGACWSFGAQLAVYQVANGGGHGFLALLGREDRKVLVLRVPGSNIARAFTRWNAWAAEREVGESLRQLAR